MSGLETMRSRIDALRWAGALLSELPGVDPRTPVTLASLAKVLEEAYSTVAIDYPDAVEEEPAAEPDAEVESEPEAPPAPPPPPARPRISDEQLDAAERAAADGVITAPAPVIRAWAAKFGVRCNAVGSIGREALAAINAKRDTMGLLPFVQRAPVAEAP
jgi:hypothetical protein